MKLNTWKLEHNLSFANGNRQKRNAVLICTVGIGFLLFSLALSITFGAAEISVANVFEAIFHFDAANNDHQIIWELRLPRTIGGMCIGASFAVAGAIMQGMTRNPLAESGILGLNAGGVFALALCLALAPNLSFMLISFFCFIGAAIGAILVFGIGSMSQEGLTPIRLVLAGAAVNALLTALSEGVALYFKVGQDLAFWFAGGVSNTSWEQLQLVLPITIMAVVAAILVAHPITLLSLGEDIATGLGQRTIFVKVTAILIVLVLVGSSVTVVGAVGFIGLIIPHITRYFVGVDYRYIIPCSAVLGATLVIYADMAARTVKPPYEIPLGAVIAVIGVPFFLYLTRKDKEVR